jgi:integrase/recombinase XerD
MTEYVTNVGKRLVMESISHRLWSLRKYFQFLLKHKVVFFDPTLSLTFPKKVKHLPKNIPTEKDIEYILNQPDTYTYVGIRDRTILELAYTCPLRNKELREISLGDIDMKNRLIYPSRVKGGRECGIPIADSTHKVLLKYLEIARPRLLKRAKESSDRLFLTESGKPFAEGTIYEIFEKYRKDRHIHPHSMRHACALHMIRHGAGIRDVQVLLGHKSLKSTQVYTVLTAKDLKDFVDRYHPRQRQEKRKVRDKR